MKILKKVEIRNFEIQMKYNEKTKQYTVQILDHRGEEPLGEGLNYAETFKTKLEAEEFFSEEYNEFIDTEIKRLEQEKIRHDPHNALAELIREKRDE